MSRLLAGVAKHLDAADQPLWTGLGTTSLTIGRCGSFEEPRAVEGGPAIVVKVESVIVKQGVLGRRLSKTINLSYRLPGGDNEVCVGIFGDNFFQFFLGIGNVQFAEHLDYAQLKRIDG